MPYEIHVTEPKMIVARTRAQLKGFHLLYVVQGIYTVIYVQSTSAMERAPLNGWTSKKYSTRRGNSLSHAPSSLTSART